MMEYLYSIIELGKPIGHDEESTIEYFIDRIPTPKTQQANLYQAITIKQLKEQIQIYEKTS